MMNPIENLLIICLSVLAELGIGALVWYAWPRVSYRVYVTYYRWQRRRARKGRAK